MSKIVIVADDNEQNVYQLQVLLGAHGFEVVPAANGAEALEKARRQPPALIISDILMPVLDGFSLCREWRRDDSLRAIPFIFYTATYTDERDRDFALGLGADAFLVKPEEPEVFMAAVRQALQTAAARPAAATAAPAAGNAPTEEAEANTFLKGYNEALVRKLEAKMLQLEQVNRALEQDVAARRQAEAGLQASSSYLQAVLDSVNDAVFVDDAQTGQILDVNKRMCEMYGYQRDEVLRMSVGEVSAGEPPYSQEDALRWLAKVREQGPQTFEWRAKHRDGHCFWVEVCIRFIVISGQARFVVVAHDIEERKQAEAALREEKDWSEAIIRSAPDIVVGLGPGAEIQIFNRYAENLTGYKAAEVIGKRWMDIFIPAANRSQVAEVFGMIVRKMTVEHKFENEIVTKDGLARLISWNNTVISDGGRFRMVLSIGEDVTERREAEKALKRIEWLLAGKAPHTELQMPAYGDLTALNDTGLIHRSVGESMLSDIAADFLDLLQTCAAVYEEDGSYALGLFSSGWCRFLDNASRRLCATNDNRQALACGKWLCHEACWKSAAEVVIESGQPYDIECSGGLRIYTVPIRAGGKVVGAVNFGYGDPPRDAATLKLLAERYQVDAAELRRHAEAYETRPQFIIEVTKKRLAASARLIGEIIERKQAEERERQLQAQLLQAQKLESIGRLAGGVAHDFNNMLSVILGYTEIALRRAEAGSPLQPCLKEIQDAAKRSAGITRQLLAFARKQTISPKELDLNETVEGMLKMLRRLIGEDIELVWKPGAGIWPVLLDPSQLDQVLANMCVNSRDAIHGVGKITIETRNASLDAAACVGNAGAYPGDFVMLVVSDNGCGMDRNTQEHIFEPFYTTKGVGQGTGLGLAMVYGIVKQNNGFISVSSEMGRGTSFRLYFRRHAATAAAVPGAEPRPALQMGANETVLVVEDDPAMLKLSMAILEDLGYQVLHAPNPNDALALGRTRAGGISLLITDVIMPGMNGRELAGRLQEICPGLKTLYMSGYTADVIAHRGVLDPGVLFIQKPFSTHELSEKVRVALR